jgi:undecaprenyl-phosphate galactose phosphotransferase
LRRLSLDELPQLWNVVRGEMSLVGPRPYYFAEVAERPDVIAALIRVRPGMTGPWQVNGRNSISPDLRMRLDKRYVDSVSVVKDIAYLAKTALCMLRADGL